MNDGLITSLVTIGSGLNSIILAVNSVSLLIGWVLFYVGLMTFVKSDPNMMATDKGVTGKHVKMGLTTLLVSAVFMNVPYFIDVVSNSLSLGDQSARTAILGGAGQVDTSSTFSAIRSVAYQLFVLGGMFGFMKGWLILKDCAYGNHNATTGKGLTHIIGGVFAINAAQVGNIFVNTINFPSLTSLVRTLAGN